MLISLLRTKPHWPLLCIALSILPVEPVLANSLESCRTAVAEQSRVKAYESCLPLAQVGDADAAFLVAGILAMGLDAPGRNNKPDLAGAVQWLKVAAANGHTEASYNLAIAYHYGRGEDRNLAKAIHNYRVAAEGGNGKAMRNLAALYETGDGVERDLASAFTLYERSAQAGLADSQLKTALMLLSGDGVPQDPVTARYWLNRSAQAGNANAQMTLGVVLADVEPSASLYWYRQAARQDNAYAAHNLALTYYRSNRAKDLLMALAYADKSLALGHQQSQPLYQEILSEIQRSPAGVSESVAQLFQGIDWLQRQPAQRYVVQLARLQSATSVRRFVSGHKLKGTVSSIALDRAGSDYVVVLKQDFATKQEARERIRLDLPAELQKEAWIRNYGSLR